MRFNELANCDLLLMVTPAQHLRAIAGELAPYVRDGQPLVLCSKGIEQASGKLMSQVVAEVLPAAEIAVLSGPSFASEIAKGLPAAVTLATPDEAQGEDARACAEPPSVPLLLERRRDRGRDRRRGEERLCHRCRHRRRQEIRRERARRVRHPRLRRDGALRGRRSARGAKRWLGYRGSAISFSPAAARNRATCRSASSSAKGTALTDVLAKRLSVTEGVYTAGALVEMAAARGIDMPIAQAVHAVISGLATVDEAIEALLARPLRAEV